MSRRKKEGEVIAKRSLLTRLSRQKLLILMLIPGLVWYALFKYLPMASLVLAFTDYGFKARVSFIGLKNFKRLLTSMIFWNAFRNTLIISLANIIFYFPFPIVIALLINELKSFVAKRAIQFLIYIPYFFSWVVVGTIFVNLLSPSSGPVNLVIKALGGEPIYFMANPQYFRGILISSYIWRQMGYGAVIYIASLTTIEPQLYEAAMIDGAGHMQRLWHITIPGLRPTIVTMLLLNLASVLKIFEQVLVMYNAAVYDVADVLQTYVYREGVLSGDMGYSIAVGMFTSIISLILVLGTNKVSARFLDESIL